MKWNPVFAGRINSPRKGSCRGRNMLNVLILLLACAPALLGAERAAGVVVVPVANIYSTMSADADVVSQAICGSNLEILDHNSGWVKIKTSDQYSGWMMSGDLRQFPASETGYALGGGFAQVSSLSANLYRETDITTHRPLMTVPFESRLEVIRRGEGADADWLQVRLPDQRSAWIQKGDVDLNPRKVTIPESIALARRFIGVTYTWGGSSSFGYDCSGFTQMVVRSRGITMPRDADLQAAWSGAVAVERKKLRAGDLLFFGSGVDHITHTGIYIGHGRFIQDTPRDHPGVQISRLNDQPWRRLLVACRRIN